MNGTTDTELKLDKITVGDNTEVKIKELGDGQTPIIEQAATGESRTLDAFSNITTIVASNATTIKTNALKGLELANTLETMDLTRVGVIETSAFEDFSATGATIRLGTITSIGDGAFFNSKLSKLNMTIGSGLETIGSGAFAGASLSFGDNTLDLSSAGDKITKLPDYLFLGFSPSVEQTLKLGSGVTEIGEGAFACARKLSIGESNNADLSGITAIGASAFNGYGTSYPEGEEDADTNKQTLKFGSSLTVIGESVLIEWRKSFKTTLTKNLTGIIIGDAIAVQFVGENGEGGANSLTGQLATLTQNLTTVTAGQEIAAAAGQQPPAVGTVQAIAAAVTAVGTTMGQITNLKEAEGLSDTVVDAIGILENAWNELREVRLGNANNGGTAVSAINTTAIQGVTQEQVDTLTKKCITQF